ncbi:rhodanese-like domain-containing protein [Actinoplanes sp. NPDC049802]|uniref:rhodanese-like domain-containing protein n=1 Tax=Actinoplanes sp. NPDC049802 TaxID=3154742 RepID=UPI0033D9B57D
MINLRRPRRVWAAAITAALLLSTGCGGTGTEPAATGAAPATATAADTGDHLAPDSFATAIARPGTVLLDVRTPQEFAAGHLPGAVNLDMEATDFATRIAELDHGGTYALYCHSGRRSGLAADQMHAAGFTAVIDLAGGISAWAATGRTLTAD